MNDLKKYLEAKKRRKHKYNAKKTNGWASGLESSVYETLRLWEKGGEIEYRGAQGTVYLTAAQISYRPDFTIYHKEWKSICYVEAKGVETARWRIIKKLWEHYGPGPLMVFKGSHKNPTLVEVIKPKGKGIDD